MPELDILHGWGYDVSRAQEQNLRTYGAPLQGALLSLT